MSLRAGSQIRVGVVGLGQLAREVHLPLLCRMAEVRVEAIADPVAEAIQQCKPLVVGARAYSSVEELLEDGKIDAVLVASPTGEHARHAEAVLAAGKALYLEKPIATSVQDGCRVVLAAGRQSPPAMMGFNYRFHPLVERAKRKLERIGPDCIEHVRSCFSIAPRPLPAWKRKRLTGGGALLDLASHHFDLLTYLLNARVATLHARVWSERTEADCAEAELIFENGIRAHCSYSLCRGEKDELEFSGPNCRIVVNRYEPMRYPAWPLGGFVAYQRERFRSPWKEVSFGRSLGAWLQAIRNREQPPITMSDGLQALQTVVAAEQSALSKP